MKWIVGSVAVILVCGALGYGFATQPNEADYDGWPHRWFAWYPVRLQGGKPIPTVQEGGRIVWLKNIERTRFFDRWVYREIGDKRELTR